MRKKILLKLLFFTIMMTACTKYSGTEINDIDKRQWLLRNITTSSGFSSTLPDLQLWERNDRYILSFNEEKHTAKMFLVVNWWEAEYSILGHDSISLHGSTTTEVGYSGNEIWVEDTLNAYGSDTFRFRFNGNKLILSSGNITLEFILLANI